MKKFFFIALAAAAMFAVSCNKEMNGPETKDVPSLSDNDKGYLAFSVNLPSGTPTKAAGTGYGEFNDGTADAANVEDILLVLFTGANEDDALLASAYNLSDYRNSFTTNSRDQITVSSSKIVSEIAKSTLTGTVSYAFVILNDHNFYEVKKAAGQDFTTLWAEPKGNFTTSQVASTTLGSGTPMTNETTSSLELTGMTFSEFKKLLVDESNRNYSETSFLMTNATYTTTNAAGWGAQSVVRTLVPVTDNIKSSRSAAEASPAAVINVERVLAKVQVDWSGISKLQNNSEISAEVLAWDLDNVNTVSYLAKNFGSSWAKYGSYAGNAWNATSTGFRMIEAEGIETAAGPSYRTHWAIDPNYTGNTQKYTLFTRAGETSLAIERPKQGIYYCPENTFDVTNMTDENTTRLVIKTRLNDGKDFFTVTENASVLYQNDPTAADAKSIQAYIFAAIANRKDVRTFLEEYYTTAPDLKSLFDLPFITAYVKEDGSLTDASAGNKEEKSQRLVNVTAKTAPSANLKTAYNQSQAQTALEAVAASCKAYFMGNYHFYYYPGGISYYQALIKHFGDIETNWVAVDGMVNKTTATNGVYVGVAPNTVTDPEDRYLGRYGIVRNNWYNINVTGIRNIGSSVIPDFPGNPDDKVENYIAIQINILPWVMRVQEVVL